MQLDKRAKQELRPAQIKLIATRGQDDPKEMYDLLGTKEQRKELDRQFKNEKSNFKIAIVVDMWLTGFDVPFLDSIYIDKPIQRHNLIQTISRVNRKFEGKNKGLVVDYIGIKNQMNLALKQYSEGDKDNFEDIAESIIIVRNHLDLLAKIFHTFDNSKYFKGTTIQQLNTLNLAAEFVQQTKEFETRFMGLVKRLKAAYDICSGSEQLTQSERDYTHFYLAVRSIVFKLTKGNAPDTAQMNAKVRDMIKEALQSEGVEEIFKLGDEGETEQDLFDADYLAKIDKIKLPNTKIKLLQQLLAKVISEIRKVNRVKGIDFTKKMQALVERYNQRDENDILRSEVYEEMAEQLTNLIWEVHKEFSAGDVLGIDFEEKAFYDILKELCIKYDFKYPEDKMIELAKAVKDLVDAQAKFPDWNKRDDIKAALKVGLILLLDEFGYPPVERDEVYVEIFEQAENFALFDFRQLKRRRWRQSRRDSARGPGDGSPVVGARRWLSEHAARGTLRLPDADGSDLADLIQRLRRDRSGRPRRLGAFGRAQILLSLDASGAARDGREGESGTEQEAAECHRADLAARQWRRAAARRSSPRGRNGRGE